jgi:hypothetical protein
MRNVKELPMNKIVRFAVVVIAACFLGRRDAAEATHP